MDTQTLKTPEQRRFHCVLVSQKRRGGGRADNCIGSRFGEMRAQD